MGVKDGNSPYRMNARNLLPKFVSDKNPFTRPKTVPGAAQPKLPPAETVSLFDHAAAKGGTTPAAPATEPAKAAPQKIEAPKVEPRSTTPVPIPAPAATVRTEPVVARRVTPAPSTVISEEPSGLRKWARAVNPMTYLAGRHNQATDGRTRPTRPEVQGELSLENVTVMRNPLNDADLEVVPAKPVVTRDPAAREAASGDTILRGSTIRGTTVPEAAVFTPIEAGGFGGGVLDVGNAR